MNWAIVRPFAAVSFWNSFWRKVLNVVFPCSWGVDSGVTRRRVALRHPPPRDTMVDLLPPRVGRGMVGTQQLWREWALGLLIQQPALSPNRFPLSLSQSTSFHGSPVPQANPAVSPSSPHSHLMSKGAPCTTPLHSSPQYPGCPGFSIPHRSLSPDGLPVLCLVNSPCQFLLKCHILSKILCVSKEILTASLFTWIRMDWAPEAVGGLIFVAPPTQCHALLTFLLKPYMVSISYSLIWGLKTHEFPLSLVSSQRKFGVKINQMLIS